MNFFLGFLAGVCISFPIAVWMMCRLQDKIFQKFLEDLNK